MTCQDELNLFRLHSRTIDLLMRTKRTTLMSWTTGTSSAMLVFFHEQSIVSENVVNGTSGGVEDIVVPHVIDVQPDPNNHTKHCQGDEEKLTVGNVFITRALVNCCNNQREGGETCVLDTRDGSIA
jgi:hypothetical protein